MYKRALWRIIAKASRSDENPLAFTLALLVLTNEISCQDIYQMMS